MTTIDNLTFGELKQIAQMFSNAQSDKTFSQNIDKKVIIRTYASGVFFGILVKQQDRKVALADCRRLWSWQAEKSISLSAVAVDGVNPKKCRFPQITQYHEILDVLEIIQASNVCISTIEATPVSEQS